MPPRKTDHNHQGATAIRIGTSGWHYAGWWGPFYPHEVKKKDALAYYATRFSSTELNAPFYRMPTPKAVQNWFDGTPDDFRFTWKGSRYITHMKRLLVEKDSVDFLEERLELLKYKAGPILFQLPPNMSIDRERLAAFLKLLRKSRRYSFEFRHESWYDKTVFNLLADHDIALCISDHADAPAPHEVTASLIYVRNHGPSGRYHGSYSARAIADWAREMRKWRHQRRDVWCYFDNDVKSAAPKDAQKLIAKI